MSKQTAPTLHPARVADAAIAASRQMWLAGLGAAMVTRDWARNDAGQVFRSLVKEGSTVETRVIRALGHRMNSSIAVATSALNVARETALASVNGLVDTAAAVLPKLKAATVAAGSPAAKPKKSAPHANARKTRRARRSARKA